MTVTVGRQNLTSFNDYFHCEGGSSTNCDNSFSPTGLTALGDRVRVPADGRIVAWRVVGACVKSGGVACYHWLRVLRPDGGQFKFVSGVDPVAASSTCDRCAPLDGSKIDVSPALAVETGDYIALSEEAVHAVDARVMVASAMGASYNVFSGLINDGSSASPVERGSDYEPLFNADVVLDAPVVSGIAPVSGSTAGGQTVTITGNHLAGTSQVRFGGTNASCFTVISTNKVAAVAPAHAAGTVDVKVTTPGGTSASTSTDRFTFVSSPPSGGEGRGGAYVANINGSSVSQYDRCGGRLAAKTPTTVAAGSFPWAVAR